MKSDVDDKAPPPMPKSQRAEIERRQKEALIELDNRILLDRLAVAMSVKNIDNERKKITFISLMEGKKKRENSRIERDNRRLLSAIQHTVPVYNHIMWEREAEKRVHILKNMTSFPDLFEERRTEANSQKKAGQKIEKDQQKSLLYKLDQIILDQIQRGDHDSVPNTPSTAPPKLSPMSSPGKSTGRPRPLAYVKESSSESSERSSRSFSPHPSPATRSSPYPAFDAHQPASSSTSSSSLPPLYFVDGMYEGDHGMYEGGEEEFDEL